jgi:ligand-binding SRPBCC domain-containing protein
MPRIEIATSIHALRELCFDLARDIDLHTRSTPGTYEKAVAGVTTGLIGLGEQVTWEATHLGIRQRLTSRITAFDFPRHFRDSQVLGAFRWFDHDHLFETSGDVTIMRDVFEYQAPFGLLGTCADLMFLRRYLTTFLTKRSLVIKAVAEGRQQQGRK